MELRLELKPLPTRRAFLAAVLKTISTSVRQMADSDTGRGFTPVFRLLVSIPRAARVAVAHSTVSLVTEFVQANLTILAMKPALYVLFVSVACFR